MKLALKAEIIALSDKYRRYANACIADEMEDFKQGLLVQGYTPESEEYRDAIDEARKFAFRDHYEPPFGTRNFEAWACHMDSCLYDYVSECEDEGRVPTLADFMRGYCPTKALDILTKEFGEIFVTA